MDAETAMKALVDAYFDITLDDEEYHNTVDDIISTFAALHV